MGIKKYRFRHDLKSVFFITMFCGVCAWLNYNNMFEVVDEPPLVLAAGEPRPGPNKVYVYWEGSETLPLLYYKSLETICRNFGRENVMIASTSLKLRDQDKDWFPYIWHSYKEDVMDKDIVQHIETKLKIHEKINPAVVKRVRKVHFSDLFRILVLYKYGGLYTDIDAIWVNGKELLGTSFIVVYNNNFISNGCIGMATPKHSFMKKVVDRIKTTYNPSVWGTIGGLLMSKFYEEYKHEFRIINYFDMYGIHWTRIQNQKYYDKDDQKIIDGLKNGTIFQVHMFGKNFNLNLEDFPKKSLHAKAYKLATSSS